MTMSIDADGPGTTKPGSTGIPCRSRNPRNTSGRSSPTRVSSRNGTPDRRQLPGHVEHAAAREHEVPPEVDVEAQGAEQGLRAADHRSASGSARSSPSARNRS